MAKMKADEMELRHRLTATHRLRIDQLESIMGFDDRLRGVLVGLVGRFGGWKGEAVQKEFERFLGVMDRNIEGKGEGFLGNDFVSFLVSERSRVEGDHKKFMFAFGKREENRKIANGISGKSGIYDSQFAGSTEEEIMTHGSEPTNDDLCDNDNDKEKKLLGSLRFVNNVLLGKNQQALKHILMEKNFDFDRAELRKTKKFGSMGNPGFSSF